MAGKRVIVGIPGQSWTQLMKTIFLDKKKENTYVISKRPGADLVLIARFRREYSDLLGDQIEW